MRRSILLSLIVSLMSTGVVMGQSPPQGYATPSTPRMVVVAQPQQMKADLGGGFIQFLFGERAPPQQQPQPQIYGASPPPQQQQQIYGAPQGYMASVAPNEQPQIAMDPRYLRQEVEYRGKEAPGTVVIDTPDFFLYLVEPGGRAMRYGIGVGRPGFTWAGTHKITAKKEWPDWVPPDEMLQRQPGLPHFMSGGPNNPLGARAMYIGSTLYRIHGSNEPWTIGHQVSSGCIRLRNEDVIDLYGRVKVGATVEVL